jgi:proteasome lid subunit RPN8/RPN11
MKEPDIVKVAGKCDGEVETCGFKVTKVGAAAHGEGVTGLTKAIKAVTGGAGAPADIPASLGNCKTVKWHDDGDLTVRCGKDLYVVTTEGKAFKQVNLNEAKKPSTYSTGDRIYYTGDQANESSEGIITKLVPATKYNPFGYNIHLDNGHEFKIVSPLSFEPSPGRRFWLLSEWKEKRQKDLEAFKQRITKPALKEVPPDVAAAIANAETVKLTVLLNENEHGYCVCQEGHLLLKEREIDGQDHSIDIPVKCTRGRPHALVHSHPSGNINLSRQDLITGKKTNLPICVTVRLNGRGKTRCYKVV